MILRNEAREPQVFRRGGGGGGGHLDSEIMAGPVSKNIVFASLGLSLV